MYDSMSHSSLYTLSLAYIQYAIPKIHILCTHTHTHTHTHTRGAQGIGLNAQGFANALLFCALTKQVREQLVNSSGLTWIRLKLCCRRRVIGDKHRFIASYSVRDESIQVLIKNGRTNYGSSVDNDQLTLTLTE